jgi:GTP:adenosylcobinamide-phosphate guanylyltransferase
MDSRSPARVGCVLVLAGQRGAADPVASESGVAFKVLVPVAGVPMLVRVIDCVHEACPEAPVYVSSADSTLLEARPELARSRAEGDVRHHASGPSPAASLADFSESGACAPPALVVTGDHPLLTPAIVQHFLEAASLSDADLVVGLVESACFRARFPDQSRTFVPLGRESFTGTNLFLLRTPAAARVARLWTRAEAVRKKPWRLVSLFGFSTLLGVALRRVDLSGALARVSKASGARVDAVRLPFAEAAIDVDSPGDLRLVERLLSDRCADQSALPDSSTKQSRLGS